MLLDHVEDDGGKASIFVFQIKAPITMITLDTHFVVIYRIIPFTTKRMEITFE